MNEHSSDGQLTQVLDSFFDENPDDYSDFLSKMDQAFAGVGGVTNCLEALCDQIDSPEDSATDQPRFEASFSALKRILNEQSPSQLELRAAIAIVMEISVQLFLTYGSKFEDLNVLDNLRKQSEETIEVLESKMQAYLRKSGGRKSGVTRNRQKDHDLHSAALAYRKSSKDYSVLNPGLKEVADQLDRDHTPIAYPAKGGWTQRVKDLTLKAIVNHATIISRE